ncbi:MAG: VOC family protein [Pseudomonadota bacterium]
MNNPICKIADVLFLRFELTDLEAQKEYLHHFGMQLVLETEDSIYYRGTGIAPFCYCATKGASNRFVSAAYYVDSRAELEALASAMDVEIIASDEPGGGQKVTVQDPDGIGVEVFFGVEFNDLDSPTTPSLNTGFDKSRINVLQRIGKDAEEWQLEDNEWRYKLASKVMRIGHYAINVESVDAAIKWYQETLGLLISDDLVMPDGKRSGAFMRANRGQTPVDHHVINIVGLRKGREGYGGTFGHGGFELTGSIDDLMAGHYHMKTLGTYMHEWGIGRHLLGSQIYDYWRDPAGFTLEHWTDGDLVNEDHPTAIVPAKHFSLGQYGPLPPSTFNLSLPNEKVEAWRTDHTPVVELIKPFEKQNQES